jgi:hypothetical protein
MNISAQIKFQIYFLFRSSWNCSERPKTTFSSLVTQSYFIHMERSGLSSCKAKQAVESLFCLRQKR